MGSINTEEAARRLARVILSDIELYNRERPKQGETLEGQIEEGRKLFASRVTPDLVPVFGLVLSDRALGRVNAPAAAEPPSTGASTAAVSPADASPASDARRFKIRPHPPPRLPRILSRISPRPLPLRSRRRGEPRRRISCVRTRRCKIRPHPSPRLPRILSRISSRPLPPSRGAPPRSPASSRVKIRPRPPPRLPRILSRISPRPLPLLRRRPCPTNQRSPLKIRPHPPPRLPRILSRISPRPLPFLRRRLLSPPALTARVPPAPLAPETPAVLAQALPAAPPAHEIPIPVLTARFSVPRLLAIVSVVAATVAVLYHFVP